MSFTQQVLSDPGNAAAFVLLVIAYALIGLAPVAGLLYVVHFLLTLPLRRNERARIFLDLLELGLQDGRSPEAAITDASATGDPSVGARFHQLANYLRQGVRLGAALNLVPRLLPPQVRAMLRAGERIGDMRKIIPACRHLLGDAVSQVRGAMNYVVLLAFCVTPLTVILPIFLAVKVLPVYQQVFSMDGQRAMPAFSRMVFSQSGTFILIQAVFLALLWLALLAYVGGPRLRGWIERVFPTAPSWLQFQMPWRRKRLQRDFSAMLAVLLEANVPEAEAVMFAAESTANTTLLQRAALARTALAGGVKLPEALRVMDNSGELRWRIANALHGSGGFLCALAGWHEALDARAFQLEQAAAQSATTALVLCNGVVVAAITIGMFLLLIQLLNEALLW